MAKELTEWQQAMQDEKKNDTNVPFYLAKPEDKTTPSVTASKPKKKEDKPTSGAPEMIARPKAYNSSENNWGVTEVSKSIYGDLDKDADYRRWEIARQRLGRPMTRNDWDVDTGLVSMIDDEQKNLRYEQYYQQKATEEGFKESNKPAVSLERKIVDAASGKLDGMNDEQIDDYYASQGMPTRGEVRTANAQAIARKVGFDTKVDNAINSALERSNRVRASYGGEDRAHAFAGLVEGNKEKTPERIIADVEQEFNRLSLDDNFQKELVERSVNLGMTPGELERETKGYMLGQAEQRVRNTLIGLNVDAMEQNYLIENLKNSVMFLPYNLATESNSQAQIRMQAQEAYREKHKDETIKILGYDTGMLPEELGGTAVNFFAETPLFMITGGIGGKVSMATINAYARREALNLIRGGMAKEAAINTVMNRVGTMGLTKVMEGSVKKNLTDMAVGYGAGMLASGVNLATYNAISTFGNQIAVGDLNVGEGLASTGEGLLLGGALGFVGRASAAPVTMRGIGKYLWHAGSFAAEATTFASSDYLKACMDAREGEKPSFCKTLAESTLQLVAMKAGSTHTYKNFATWAGNFKTNITQSMGGFQSKQWRNNENAQRLENVLSRIRVNNDPNKWESLRTELETAYENVMKDNSLDYDLRMHVNLMSGKGELPMYTPTIYKVETDSNMVISYDRQGMRIQTREMKSAEAAQAEAEKMEKQAAILNTQQRDLASIKAEVMQESGISGETIDTAINKTLKGKSLNEREKSVMDAILEKADILNDYNENRGADAEYELEEKHHVKLNGVEYRIEQIHPNSDRIILSRKDDNGKRHMMMWNLTNYKRTYVDNHITEECKADREKVANGDANDAHEAYNAYQLADQAMMDVRSGTGMRDPYEILFSSNTTPEEKEIARNYLKALEVKRGVEDKVNATVETRMREKEREVAPFIYEGTADGLPPMGRMRIKGKDAFGNVVYVKKGEITPDGMVNVVNEDGTDMRPMRFGDLIEVETENTDQMLAIEAQKTRTAASASADADMLGRVEQGDEITIGGKAHTVLAVTPLTDEAGKPVLGKDKQPIQMVVSVDENGKTKNTPLMQVLKEKQNAELQVLQNEIETRSQQMLMNDISGEVSTEEVVAEEPQLTDALPMDENGNIDIAKTTPAEVYDKYLIGGEEAVNEKADAKIAQIQAKLEALNTEPVQGETDREQDAYLAERSKRRKELTEQLHFWEDVKNEKTKRKALDVIDAPQEYSAVVNNGSAGLLDTDIARKMRENAPDAVDFMQKIAEQTGLQVRVVAPDETNRDENGKINGRTLTVVYDAEDVTPERLGKCVQDMVMAAFGHELNHHLYKGKSGNEAFKQYMVDLARGYIGKDKFDAHVKSKEDAYKKAYEKNEIKEMPDERYLQEETVGDIVGQMFSDEAFRNRFLSDAEPETIKPWYDGIVNWAMKVGRALGGQNTEAFREFDRQWSLTKLQNEVKAAYDNAVAKQKEIFKTDEEATKESLRTLPEPKKVKYGYKAFKLKYDRGAKEWRLYPPQIEKGTATPFDQGYLDADAAPIVAQSKTGRGKTKEGLSFRPGWHLGYAPFASQFLKKDGTKQGDIVFALVEFDATNDYQRESDEFSKNKNGEWVENLGGVPYIPLNGYYNYRTNKIDPNAKPWAISGAMKVHKILSRAEENDIMRKQTEGRYDAWTEEIDNDILTPEILDDLNGRIKHDDTDLDAIMQLKEEDLQQYEKQNNTEYDSQKHYPTMDELLAVRSEEDAQRMMGIVDGVRGEDGYSLKLSGKHDRQIPSFTEAISTIKRLFAQSKKRTGVLERKVIAGVDEKQINDLKKEGVLVDSTWVHAIDDTQIGHAMDEHGNEAKEKTRDQIAITEDDFEKIPEIINTYDSVTKSPNKNKQGNEVIVYEKKYPDGTTYYVEEIRKGRKSLAFETMYKKGSSDGVSNNDSPSTSLTASDSSLSAGKVTENISSVQEKGREIFNNMESPAMNDAVSVDDSALDLSKMTDGDQKLSIRTEKDLRKSILDFAKGKDAKKLGWTPEQINEVVEETSALIDFIHKGIAGDPNYDEFAAKDPTLRVDWRDGVEKPVVTWVRNNIEYKYDMSADTFCINNEGLETVLASPVMADLMVHTAKFAEYGSDDYLRLYETLRDMGFVVPCKGCFDAAMRIKMLPSVAQNFVDLVNATIDERNKNPEKFDAALRKKANGKGGANGLPTAAGTKEEAVRIGVAGDNLTEHIDWTQLMSAEGQTKALSDWGGIFRAWQKTGAGRPKDKLLPEPYTGQIVTRTSTIIGKYGEKTPSFRDMEVNQGTGLRRNSHSEFRPVLAVDEIQFMRDAWLKNLCVFKYMKELDDVRLFGKMGTKFNMSAFAGWEKDGVAAGLDKDANYVWAEESVGGREFPYVGEDGKTHYDGYRGLQEAMKYINKDCSLSSVVMSVPHLIKMFTDVPTPTDKSGNFGSLIPFHASGATAESLFRQGLGRARALTGDFMTEAMTDYNKGVTNFEQVQNDRFGKGWVCMLGKRAGTDVKEGHKIEFANGTIYRNKELGITLYSSAQTYKNYGGTEDFKGVSGPILVYDAEGGKVAHPFTIDYNDKVREINSKYGYKEAADYYVQLLRENGFLPRFDFEVPEDVFLKMCADAKVDPNHPKIGWKGEGHGWSPCDAESYYSVFCDYGMTDPATGEWAPHRPILDGQKNADAFEKALPENYLEIIQDGINRYTTRKSSEDARINEAIQEYCKRSVAEGKMSQKEVDAILAKHGVGTPGEKFSKRAPLTDAQQKAMQLVDGKMSEEEMVEKYGAIETPEGIKFKEDGDSKYSMRVFHGSAADFEKFDHRFFNTGEGSMYYGAGTYVTNVEDTARMYAGIAAGRPANAVVIEGKRHVQGTSQYGDIILGALSRFNGIDNQLEKAASSIEYRYNTKDPATNDDSAEKRQARKAAELIRAGKVELSKPERHIYQVDIPDDTGRNYIDFNGFVRSDDMKVVIKALYEKVLEADTDGMYDSEAARQELKKEIEGTLGVRFLDGSGFYGTVSSYLGGDVEASKFLSNLGYTGIKVPTGSTKGGDGRGMNYVIFNADDAQIAGHEKFSKRIGEKDPFYSNAAKAVEDIKQEKATAEQWLAMITKNGGLKKGEDKWMGLSDWLNQQRALAVIGDRPKTITKEELQQFIDANSIKLEEVHYTEKFVGDGSSAEIESRVADMLNGETTTEDKYSEEAETEREQIWNNAVERYGSVFEQAFDKSPYISDGEVYMRDFDSMKTFVEQNMPDKYEMPIHSTRMQYQTEGLKNNKEIAITVPSVKEYYGDAPEVHFADDATEGKTVVWMRFGDAETKEANPRVDELDAEIKRLQAEENPDYDYIAKLGMQKYAAEVNKPKGQKVLVIDEVQSQRHQEGRKYGYTDRSLREQYDDAIKELRKYRNELSVKYNGYYESKATAEELARESELKKKASEIEKKMRPTLQSVPAAPFENNWMELGMKRMLRYAAENGYDKIAWTTGQQQVDRYNLNKVVEKVMVSHEDYDYSTNEWGDYTNGKEPKQVRLFMRNKDQEDIDFAVDKNGNIMNGDFKGERLDAVVGKELAEKILSTPVEEYETEYVVKDLSFGGEGMKAFYDKMIPSFMQKYGKKWGAKVGEVELDLPNEADRKMWSVDVTPEMKESVTQGQPMFSLRVEKAKESARKYGYGVPYTGSKNKIAEEVIDILPKGIRFVDLFAGGGAMSHAALLSGKYDNVRMNDKFPAGIQLFMDGIDGKYKDYDKHVSNEDFAAMAGTPEGLLWSHMSNNRSYQGDRGLSRARRVAALQSLSDMRDRISTSDADYRDVEIQPGDVLYADIPYYNTDNSAYRNAGRFDWEEFSDWAKQLDQPVFVSSKEAPEGFTEIWSKEVNNGSNGKRTERVFVQDKFADDPNGGAKYSLRADGNEGDFISRKSAINPGKMVTIPKNGVTLQSEADKKFNKDFDELQKRISKANPLERAIAEYDKAKLLKDYAEEMGYPNAVIYAGLTRAVAGELMRTNVIPALNLGYYLAKRIATGKGRLRGMYLDYAGKTYGIADNIKTADEFKEVLAHESTHMENVNGGRKYVDAVLDGITSGDITRKDLLDALHNVKASKSYDGLSTTDMADEVIARGVGRRYAGLEDETFTTNKKLNEIIDEAYGEREANRLRNQAERGHDLSSGTNAGGDRKVRVSEEDTFGETDRRGGESLPGRTGLIPTKPSAEGKDIFEYAKEMRDWNNETKYSFRIPSKIGNRMRQRNGETPEQFEERKQRYQQGIVASAEEARKRVIDQIRAQIDNKQIGTMGKRDLNDMLTQVKEADVDNLADVLGHAQHTLNTLEEKVQSKGIRRLLNFKVGDKNGRGMSIAKNVDEGTARIIKELKKSIGDLMVSGLEEDMTDIRREIRKLQEEDKQRQTADPEAEPQNAARIEELKNDLQALQKQKEEILEQKLKSGDIDVQMQLDTLMEKQADRPDEWTERDSEQLIGLQIQQKRQQMMGLDNQMLTLNYQKNSLQKQIDSLTEEMNKPGTGDSKRDVLKLKREGLREQMRAIDEQIDNALVEKNRVGQQVVEDLTNLLGEGKEKLMAKLDAERERHSALVLGTLDDIGNTGKETRMTMSQYQRKEQTKPKKWKGVFNGVLSSFEYLCQSLGSHVGRDNYLYRQFITGEEGVVAAESTYLKNKRETMTTLNDKCEEIYGKDWKKVMKDNEKVVPESGVFLYIDNNGMEIPVELSLSKGAATYLYMVWKMTDGRAKMEAQGFDEVSMAEIEEFIGAENMRWADWVQDEFLVNLRERYNEVYRDLFNTSMSNIENYVPLKIFSEDRRQEVDVAQQNMPDTLNQKTGSLVNRVFNLNPVDYTNSAYSIIAEHVDNMEEWAAYARVRQDLNYILSSTAVRNQLNENNAGDFERFKKACQIATHTYRSETPEASGWVNWLTKGLAGANIAFRNTTALKQMLSVPAFMGYTADPKYQAMLVKNMFGGYVRNLPAVGASMLTLGVAGREAVKDAVSGDPNTATKIALGNTLRWCIDNIPSFKERVAKGAAGNVVLEEVLGADKNWHDRLVAELGEYGMAANGLVDAITCSIGMKTIYDYKYGKMLEEIEASDMTPEEEREAKKKAHNLALREAEVYVNATQQSNHSAFLAPVQRDGDIASKMFTLYKNSPISYARKAALSAQDLMKLRNWEEQKTDLTNKYIKEGSESLAAARQKAVRRMWDNLGVGVIGALVYGYGLNWLWNEGGKGLLGLFQSNDEEDKDVATSAAEAASPLFTAVPGVDFLVNTLQTKEINPLLLFGLQENIARDIKQHGLFSQEIAFDVLNTASRVGFAVDLNTLGNMYMASKHLFSNGLSQDNTAKWIDFMYFMNTPNSNRKQVARELYKDLPLDQWLDNIMYAEKYSNEGQLSRFLGMKTMTVEKQRQLIKEYMEAHATDTEKEQMVREEANKVGNILKEFENLDDLKAAFEAEKDGERKAALEKAIIKKMNDIASLDKDPDEVAEDIHIVSEGNDQGTVYAKVKEYKDLIEDNAIKEAYAKASKVHKTAQKKASIGNKTYAEEHADELNAYRLIGRYNQGVREAIKACEAGRVSEAEMLERIRNMRKDTMDKLKSNK